MATKKTAAAAAGVTRRELQATERRLTTAIKESRRELKGGLEESRRGFTVMIEEYGHALTGVVERIELQNKAAIEALHATAARLERRIEEVRTALLLRMETLELVVRKNSEDMQSLRHEIAELRAELRLRWGGSELRKVEARVARIEEKVGPPPASGT